jgi:hypothetical protein
MSKRAKILLLLSFPLIILMSALLAGETSDIEIIPSSSTYSSGTAGTKALFLLLQELGIEPVRFRTSFRDLDAISGTMVVVDPHHVNFTEKQARNIEQWVKKGNRLVIFEAARSGSRSKDEVLKSFPWRLASGPASHFGLNLKQFRDQPRMNLHVSLPGFNQEIIASVSGENRWEKPSDKWRVLAGDESGPLLLTRNIGDGQVFACSDPSIVSNRFIRREQNLRLALGLLIGKNRGGQMFFDEFHHGHRVEQGFWSHVGDSVFAWIFFQIAAGLAFFFYSRKAEFAGRFRSLSRRQGRSYAEYVDSMANIFESCKADSAALESILTRFLGRASRMLGIPFREFDRTSLLKNASKIPDSMTDLAELIEDSRRAIRSGAPDEILDAARKLAAHESTMSKAPFRTTEGKSRTSADTTNVVRDKFQRKAG